MFPGTRKSLVLIAAAVICYGGQPFSAMLAAGSEDRPNILFIMSDDHGYQAMSCYGSKVNQTPNLDRIARGGMRFDRAFVTNSICGPSRAVILTGKYSHLNGFVRNGNTFNGKQQTVAKLLQKAGYQTAVIGKWHLKSRPTGFDDYHVLIGQGPYYNPRMRTPSGEVRHTGYTTDIITDVALDWLQEKRDKTKPFFLMYQHKAPHRNWQPPARLLKKYDDKKIPEPATLFDDYSGRGSAARRQTMTIARHLNPNDLKLVPQRGLNDQQRAAWDAAYQPKNEAFRKADLQGKELVRWKYQRYVKDYLRCVDAIDENVGRVLDYLDKSGLADNTVVVYTSDQGWYLGEHGWYDKRWMYEESFRTPLLIRWPGKSKPKSVNRDLVMNLDFAPTFLEIAGVKIPSDMQGASLKPLLEGASPEDWRKSVYYHYYEFPGAHMVHKHYGVRTDRYKLIHFYDEIDEWELYDLKQDPHELKSVYSDPSYAPVVKELKAELQRLRRQYKDDGQVVDFQAQTAAKVPFQLAAAFDFAKLDKASLESGEIVDGHKGKALKLNGSNAALQRPSSQILNPAYKPMVVGGWCNPARDAGVIIAQGGESLGYTLYLARGRAFFAIRASGQLKRLRGPRIAVDRWTHLAAVLDKKGQAQLYIDGKPHGRPKRIGFVPQQPADGLSLGADTGSQVGPYETASPFDGMLEDVRVYWGPLQGDTLINWAASR